MAGSVAIIIDNGTGFIKAGCTSDETPRVTIPSLYEREAAASQEVSESKKLAVSKLAYERAIKRSVISNWEEIEKLWENVINLKLKMVPEEHPLFLTEPVFNPKGHREKMAEIAFEKFKSPSLFLGVQSVLAIYAYGKMFGTVLDVGHGTARAVPVFEGFAQPKASKTMHVAGEDLDSYLVGLLKKECSFDFENNMEVVTDIKKKHCYVAMSVNEQGKKETEKTYNLPDGKELTLKSALCEAPELLFDPSIDGLEGDGVHKLIQQAIDSYERDDMYANIVLSGGSTMFTGMKERLQKELCDVTTDKDKLSIKAVDGRDVSTFVGASILTALPTFSDLWLTKKEYEENGPEMVHKKLK